MTPHYEDLYEAIKAEDAFLPRMILVLARPCDNCTCGRSEEMEGSSGMSMSDIKALYEQRLEACDHSYRRAIESLKRECGRLGLLRPAKVETPVAVWEPEAAEQLA